MSMLTISAPPHRPLALLLIAPLFALAVACAATAPAQAPASSGAVPPVAIADGSADVAASSTDAEADAEAAVAVQALEYVTSVHTLLDGIAAATEQIDVVLARADVDSSEWQADLATALAWLAVQQQAVAELDPPDSLVLVQELLEEAVAQFALAADELVGGLRVMDLDQIQRGVDDLGYGIEALAEARVQLPAQS